MDLAVTFTPTAPESLAEWRERYLNSLALSQELFLEVRVPRSSAFLIHADGEERGYALVEDDESVFEFFLRESDWVFGETVLKQFIASTGIRKALVKTFDTLFLSSALDHQQSIKTVGLLSRDYLRRELDPAERPAYISRQATAEDFDSIRALDQDVFTDSDRLRLVIERNAMWVYCVDSRIIGFGILRPVIVGRDAIDVGIALDRSVRGKGWAPYLVQELFDHARSQGLVPVGGCAVDNLASRAMAERIGLVARHRLLEIRF